jgi:hypothetical protein
LLIQLLCKYEEYKDHIIARFHELRTDGQNRTIPEIERIINMEMRALESEIVADREAREELIRATETRGHVFPETEYEKRLAASLNRVDATQAESDDIDVEIAKIKAETAEITERVEKKSVVCLLF